MNVYAIFPLIATIAYIPLVISTASSRPWQKRHTLFITFLVSAMLWSMLDFIFRNNMFPDQNFLLLKIIVFSFSLMAVQFHCFSSSFYSQGQGRWLPFAYISLAVIIAMLVLGVLPEGVVIDGNKLYPDYGRGIIIMAVPLLTLAGRNLYVFRRRLKTINNPVLSNQVFSLFLGYCILVSCSLITLLPYGKEFPISHFGNLLNAFILSYATVRHQLVDIRVVLRRGLAWATLGIIGGASFWLLLSLLHIMLGFQIDMTATFTATAVAIVAAVIIYRLRSILFIGISRAFQGQRFDYRRSLTEFSNKIHSVFSLKEQGRELLELVTKAVNCNRAALFFPEAHNGVFIPQIIEPRRKDNLLAFLKLTENNPILEYMRQEQKSLTREDLAVLTRLRSLWEQERQEIESAEVELFIPLISREKLIAILALGKKLSGKYSLEDLNLLKDVTERVAVSMEKEYLRDQLREREEELSVINRSSVIITSSLNIQGIYDSFIDELKKVVEVNWAAICLIEEDYLYILALSTDAGSAWKVGDKEPIKDTATGWLASHKEAVYEPDISQGPKFKTGKKHLEQGIRSMIYLPLIAKGEVIGSLTVGSRNRNAYSQRQIMLLERLSSQIAMPVDNARLYAKVEEKARIDELTGLLNRRSLDEMIASEISRHSRYGGIFSLVILDLDSFKAFNDNYGHLAGDKLLGQIGSIIKDAIRGTDYAFRYGGDEFAILCPQTAVDAARRVAERVRKQVAMKARTGSIPVTTSLGLASWPADGISADEIIAAADAALYSAKRAGGNQSCCASGSLLPVDDILYSYKGDPSAEVLSAIYSLVSIVDARDRCSQNHSRKVVESALDLAKAMHMELPEISRLETCALLHDIGKIGISDEILNKPGKLSESEWEIIKIHPQLGATIISRARQLAPCIAGILHHHERYDGTGYPKGLGGEDIPLEARILAIADAYAAMTSDRPYTGILTVEEALEELKRCAGTQFDPNLVRVFISMKITALLEEDKVRGG